MVVPSPPFPEVTKAALRRTAIEARKAYAASLSDGDRALLEQQLAERLTSLCAGAKVVGGYSPLGAEISPLLAMEEARAVGAIVAFPAFADPGKPFRFLAGDPSAGGPFGILQPRLTAPPVEPDVILVPLIAVDRFGTRLGRGKGHYDRVLAPLKRNGARLIGVGWPLQRLDDEIPRDPWDVAMDGFACPERVEWFDPPRPSGQRD
jgi:5-formyltetrahydrofolate cyclo-ligase